MGNLAQTGSIASSVAAVVRTFSSQESTERLAVWIAGAVTALLLAVAIFGGMKRIGSWSERMIPAAVLVFSFFSLFLLARHIRAIPSAFSLILRCAFSPRAVGGAVAGYGVKKAMYWGLCRSAFSNEAGLGSAGIAHAGAETDHPVRQGFFGIFEVFADTLVVCTLTALTVLVALPPSSLSPNQAGAEPLIAAFATVFGQRASAVIVAASLIVFAFSTLLGWSLYGCRCVSFLVGHQGTALYRLLFVFLSFFGALIPLKTIWQISDTFNGLMAIPNFIALFFLCPTVLSLIQDFEKKHPHRRKKRSR
jgi:AGCS family alanine or glycine:cation symporter